MTSLRTRLMISYALLAGFAILAVSLSANLFLESRFTAYVSERIAAQKQQTLAELGTAWSAMRTWNHDELSVIGMNMLENGIIMRVQDGAKQVVWDARTHNNGLCEQMLTTLARNMDSRYKGWNGSYQEDPFPIKVGDNTVGTVWFGYYGPFWFTDAELYFLSSLNQIVIVMALVALALAAAFGWWMARGLARPIQQVTATAQHLRSGDLSARCPPVSGAREIADLAASINSLGHDLGEQDALRQRLTSDVSHELRTPLATLRGHLEAMIDGIWPADAERLSSCRDEVLRLSRLVGQIEGLTRAEQANTLDLATFELPGFIDRLCAVRQGDFREKDIAFSWEAEPGNVRADADKLIQILVNLLSNAAKYTPAGGSVSLRAWFETKSLIISVRDSGAGIPAADLPHVFERFYRVDASRATSSGGAGIGLTIALTLARLHGGTIEASSEPSQGSDFRVVLPR